MAVPFPFNLAAIATGIASVMAGVASAKAVLSEVPGGGGGGGDVSAGGGGADQGPSGMGPLTPNMEGIQASALGGDGGGGSTVQAYVVENDISNAQALQEELDVQSTL